MHLTTTAPHCWLQPMHYVLFKWLLRRAASIVQSSSYLAPPRAYVTQCVQLQAELFDVNDVTGRDEMEW